MSNSQIFYNKLDTKNRKIKKKKRNYWIKFIFITVVRWYKPDTFSTFFYFYEIRFKDFFFLAIFPYIILRYFRTKTRETRLPSLLTRKIIIFSENKNE